MHSLLTVLFGWTFSPSFAAWLLLAADVIGLCFVPSVLVRRAGAPLSAMSWVLALLALPFVGALAWLLLGRSHLRRQRRLRHTRQQQLCARCAPLERSAPTSRRIGEIAPFATGDRRWEDGAFPLVRATSIRVLCDGGEAFAMLRKRIDSAQHEILVLFYIWQVDDTGDDLVGRLVERARAGVRIHVLVDAVGSWRFLRRRAARLRRAGVAVVPFLPARFRPWAPTFNFRNHRKLVVVDGDVAFTGGMNVGDEYASRWHDLAIEVRGPVVTHLRDVFAEDWHFASGQALAGDVGEASTEPPATGPICAVIASGPDRAENRAHDAFILAAGAARRRLWLTTPYFIPSPALLSALRAAALRGVDVQVIVPRYGDLPIVAMASKSYYPLLLAAGVKLFEYERATLHAKALVIDDDAVIVGSANADVRSFRLNFELVCLLFDRELAGQLADIFNGDRDHSVPVDAAGTAARPRYRVFVEAAANLMSPLL